MVDSDQVSLYDNTEPTNLYKRISELVAVVCKEQKISNNYIKPVKNVDDSVSVWLCEPMDGKSSVRVFNLLEKKNKNAKYFDVELNWKRASKFKVNSDNKIISKLHISKKSEFADKTSLYFPLEDISLWDYLKDLLICEIENFAPSENFGCCDKYVACSDAKKCLHKNLYYAKSCLYRKNLENGRIFYGKNAVVK